MPVNECILLYFSRIKLGFFTQTINHSPGPCVVIQGKFAETKILVAIALFLGR